MQQNTDVSSSLDELTVEQLVVLLQSSSSEESSLYCKEIIRRFEPLLRKSWRRVEPNVEYADFVQDVFLHLFKGLPYLHDAKAFPGYFRRIALTVATDHARRHFVRSSVEVESLAEQVVSDFDQNIYRKIVVRSYLEYLSGRERQILIKTYFEEQSDKEIASELGLTTGAIRMAKSRALKRLREILRGAAEKL